ncbi:glutathione peroxidase [Bacillus solimangrovi]|uniref:Glutathione peroxidase n=1 Tax=Bacillus solimangrovi TaxID=1305675 RepID=A0A1E5LB42_9BACI|nr:glutathione peroxidase [Bacillus solimangrovi]OEH91298.1 glutathione peroxidase [Bacillus solimangrovi]
MTTVYDFEVTTITGKQQSLSDYRGNVILIVNTASKCGFTPQFEGLQKLYDQYKDEGFTVLGFPSDQFMNQEFAEDDQIEEFCKLNYGVDFPMFSKTIVKGKNAHPLFKYLINEKNGLLTSEIKWNFSKFLINRDGVVEERYAPATNPDKLEDDIRKLLAK